MDENSSGFGEESPILFKYPRNYEVHSSTNSFTLDQLYKELVAHLKKSKIISRDELKLFLEQVNVLQPEDPKNRWTVKKIRGLLNYILKKRSDFQKFLIKGQIIIYEKETFKQWPHMKTSEPSTSTISSHIPSCMLTNNNFVSMDVSCDQNGTQKEVDKGSYDYSQDLFYGNTAESLHCYAQENYQLLKSLTQNSTNSELLDTCTMENDSKLFKIPYEISNKVNKVHQEHEKVEKNYNLLVLTPVSTQNGTEICNLYTNGINSQYTENLLEEVMENNESNDVVKEENIENVNIFDNLIENSRELKNEFNHNLEEMKKWVAEIISDLKKLDIKKNYKWKVKFSKNIENSSMLNTSSLSTGSSELNTYYSEENFKIIKEACLEFKKKVEQRGNLKALHNLNYLS